MQDILNKCYEFLLKVILQIKIKMKKLFMNYIKLLQTDMICL